MMADPHVFMWKQKQHCEAKMNAAREAGDDQNEEEWAARVNRLCDKIAIIPPETLDGAQVIAQIVLEELDMYGEHDGGAASTLAHYVLSQRS